MSQEELNRQAFKEEAQDLLGELENALLELEESPGDADLIDRVFRAMHTIKGSGAMFGFDDIASFTHDVETVFDRVRNGEVAVGRELLDLTLAARDRIQDMLFETEGEDRDPERSKAILDGLRRYLGEAEAAPTPEAESPAESGDEESRFYRIRFKPPEDMFHTGGNPVHLLDDLGELGPCRILANLEEVPWLGECRAETCYAWWDVILCTTAPEREIHDVFMFVEDESELAVSPIAEPEELEGDQYKKLGEILVERGDISADGLKRALSEQKRLGEVLQESGLASAERVRSALAEQEAVQEIRGRRKESEAASSIRVAANKLDDLVNLVGELVTVQAQISQKVAAKKDPALTALAEELERLSDELRDSTLGIRMLPIGTTFSRFRRLVRDLSVELGKEIELETSGAETELDKTVLERMGDPLVHLIRNSIDHGIEPPEARREKGKPETGTINLSAAHSGGEVVVTIEDDGKGMDPKALKAKAVNRGVLSPEADLTDKECFNLIFEPGFSTAESVTSVSGRGVGMDVVKRAMDELRAVVEVDSVPGRGTAISIRLPLTLAIIDGLQVRVGGEHYVIPLALVEECVELQAQQVSGGANKRIIDLRGEIVPYVMVREWFEVPGNPPPIEQVVVTSTEWGRVGLVVDSVIGEHQTVIKSLGRVYRDVEGLSGATIRGDGSLALILDVPRLVRSAAQEAQR
ncbi:chemotaxis protein CheA [Desulfohalovibrio reitneri]|uniref:chemotaxis protein CheA n=1 Tax=Desulfohalovibrio reitneri TaxID=1307759 RepID=UPI0004A6C570|nr:chemotaxis protein CheA [Desulfohalovibrio reitneri]